ncbi:hypothetical protein BYT27DRAFT_7087380 [Phlegmacium glaucopus]|nr:hypothetical protein BYT27DRAFT_7087380 [Phlegmacium glaucopus]
MQKKKEEIQSRKPIVRDVNHVYVGNLESTITITLLEDFFGHCGQIKQTIIRCSRGQAVMAGLAVPKEVLGPRDRQYASIEFMKPRSARKALACHGMVLNGSQLVVSASAADLPEVRDIVESGYFHTLSFFESNEKSGRVESMRKKQFGPMPPPSNTPQRFDIFLSTHLRGELTRSRPLIAHLTEPFTDFRDPRNDRHHIFGVSFAKGIM